MKTRWCVLSVVVVGLWAGVAMADDWYWTGICDYNEWHEICLGDWCDPNETKRWNLNNWGEILCDSDDLLFPGPTDDVYLGSGDVGLTSQGGATVYNLSLAAGGQLTIVGPAPAGVATLTLNGPLLTNAGTILLGNTGDAILAFNQTATLEGDGVVWLDRPTDRAQLNTAPGATLIVAGGQTIHGRGYINAALVNNGTVTSDSEGLYLKANDKTNNAMMKGVDGKALYVDGITLTQSAGGQLLGDGGSVSIRADSTVSGGTLATANGGGMVITSGTNTLHDVTIDDDAAVTVGGTGLIFSGSSLTNNGTMTCTVDPDLLVQDNLTLQGHGELELVGNELNTAASVTLTHASEHTIRGRGTINASLVNNGAVISTSATGFTLKGNDKTNNALMEGLAGGKVVVESITLTQSGAGELLADGGYVELRNGATVVGGTIASANGGSISNNSGSNTLHEVQIVPGADVRVYGTSLGLAGSGITSNGVFTVHYGSTLLVENDLTLAGSGHVVLSSGSLDTATAATLTLGSNHSVRGIGYIHAALANYGMVMPESQTFELTCQAPGVTNYGTIYVPPPSNIMRIYNAGLFTQMAGEVAVDGILFVDGAPLDLEGGTLTGRGTVYGDVDNSGATVAPGASAGKLTIQGAYIQDPNGVLEIELGGTETGQWDQLVVTGTANLAGTLCLKLIDDFRPQVGATFTVMTFPSRTGEFAPVELSGFPAGAAVDVRHESGYVVVEIVQFPATLVSTEPAVDGSLPKTQNNIIACVFDRAISLPPAGNPLVIVELGDPNTDVSSSFGYSIDPNDTGDPAGATLKATESGAVLVDQTWYHVNAAPGWAGVMPFAFDLCTLRGDANNSARVTTADYSEVKAHLGERTDARYDLNGSARITTADYSVVKANLGHRAPAKP